MEFVFIILIIYLLPTIIAYSRKKKNKGAIAVLNIFAGWIFGIGWLIALVWACTDNDNNK